LARSLRFVPHLLVLAFVVWCAVALRGDLQQVSLTSLLHSWNLLALAAVLSLMNYAFRIIRWRWYLARLGHPLPLQFATSTFIAGFAYTLSPGKVGEMIRARYYLPLGIPLSRTAGAFFAERLLDLVAMSALATLLLADRPDYRQAVYVAAVLVLVILVLLSVLPWQAVARRFEAATSLPRLVRKLGTGVASTLAATQPLLQPMPLAVGFLLGLAAWGLEGLGLGVLSGVSAAGPVPTVPAVGIYAVAVLVGALSFLPGGLGSTEAVMTTLLAAHGIAFGDAVFVTLACRIVTLWLAVVLGWVAVLSLRQRPLAPAVS
jgi:glycosyltransferase 2 family protein